MNHGAYQHFLCVSNDYCETSLQWILEIQGRRVIVLNGSLPGMVCPTYFSHIICCHQCPLFSVLGIVKKKERMYFEPSKSAINHWGRKDGKEERRERWREGENENHRVQIIDSDRWLKWARGRHLASAQLSINRPIPEHMCFFSLTLI